IKALRKIKDERSLEPLIRKLGDPNERIRETAREALGEVGTIENLIQALQNEDSRVREVAVKVLTNKTDDSRVTEPLIRALEDKDSSVSKSVYDILEYYKGFTDVLKKNPKLAIITFGKRLLNLPENEVQDLGSLSLSIFDMDPEMLFSYLREAFENGRYQKLV